MLPSAEKKRLASDRQMGGERWDKRLNWRPIAPAEERVEGLVVALVDAAAPILSAARWMGLFSPLSSRDIMGGCAVACFRGFGRGAKLGRPVEDVVW